MPDDVAPRKSSPTVVVPDQSVSFDERFAEAKTGIAMLRDAKQKRIAANAFIATLNPFERAKLLNEGIAAIRSARITFTRRNIGRPLVRRARIRAPRRRATNGVSVSRSTRSSRGSPPRPARPRRNRHSLGVPA